MITYVIKRDGLPSLFITYIYCQESLSPSSTFPNSIFLQFRLRSCKQSPAIG